MAKLRIDIGVKTTAVKQGLKKVKGMFRSAGKSLKSFASSGLGMLGIGAGIAGIGIAIQKVVSSSIAFQKSMAEVNTIAGLSKSKLADLTNGVKSLSKEIGVTKEELSKGLYQALSAGVPAGNSIDFLRVASKAAIGGVADVETAVDGLTTVINAWGMKSSEATKVSDIMFQTVKLGKTTFSELSQNIGNVASMASTAGISFEEVAAGLATMTKKGLDTATATTQLKGVIKNLIAPNDQLKQSLANVATANGVVDTSAMSLQQILSGLNKEVKGDSEAMNALFPDVRALNGVLTLTGQNAAGAAADLDAMKNSAGSAGGAFSEMADTTDNKLAKMKASWDALTDTLTNRFLPAIAEIAEKLAALAKVGASGVLKELFGGSYENNDGTMGYAKEEERQKMIKRFLDRGEKEKAQKLMDVAITPEQKEANKKIQSDIKDDELKADQKAAAKKATAQAKKDKSAEKKKSTAAKASARVGDEIKAMQEKLKIQEMINSGKKKEASILEKILSAEKSAGRKLTDTEKSALTTAASNLYDATKTPDKAEKAVAFGLSKASQVQSRVTSLQSVGGNLGAVNRTNTTNSILKKQLTIQTQLVQKVSELKNTPQAGNIAR